MTKEDLMKAYYIEKEIASWKEELKDNTYISGVDMSKIRSSKGKMYDKVSDMAIKSAETKRKITKKLIELENAKCEITEYILNIDDPQTRLIFKLRCLNLLNWNEVADRVGGMNSEYSVKKRFYRYLEKCG